MVVTGNEAIIRYGKQTKFDTAVDGDKSWGLSQKISGLTSTEGHKPQMDVGTATVTNFTYGGRTRDFNLEWIMSGHEFFEYLIGPKGTGDKAKEYVYSHAPTYFTQEIIIARGLDGNKHMIRKLVGCTLNSWSMSYGIEGEVKCNASVKCGREEEPTEIVAFPDVSTPPSGKPYTFDHATVTFMEGGPAVGKVQSVELSVNPNHQLVRSGGNKQAVDAHKQLLEITGKISMTLEKGVNLKYLIERKNDAVIMIALDNDGDSATSMITMKLENISFPAHALSAIEANALILEDVSFQAQMITVAHA